VQAQPTVSLGGAGSGIGFHHHSPACSNLAVPCDERAYDWLQGWSGCKVTKYGCCTHPANCPRTLNTQRSSQHMGVGTAKACCRCNCLFKSLQMTRTSSCAYSIPTNCSGSQIIGSQQHWPLFHHYAFTIFRWHSTYNEPGVHPFTLAFYIPHVEFG
jgi:hypothetical protein